MSAVSLNPASGKMEATDPEYTIVTDTNVSYNTVQMCKVPEEIHPVDRVENSKTENNMGKGTVRSPCHYCCCSYHHTCLPHYCVC